LADTDSALEVQKAIVATVIADATVNGLVSGRIYDEPPQDVAFPYIQFVSFDGSPDVETDGGEGFEVICRVDVWSRSRGGVEAATIGAALVDLFNNIDGTLTLDSKTVVMARLISASRRRDADRVTTQLIQRWQFITDG